MKILYLVTNVQKFQEIFHQLTFISAAVKSQGKSLCSCLVPFSRVSTKGVATKQEEFKEHYR